MAIFNIPGAIPTANDIKTRVPIGLSQLGTLVYDDLTFDSWAWTDLESNQIYRYDKFSLQSVQISVTKAKNIVKNFCAGREGSVKTYMSEGDYEISVAGVICETFNVFPDDQMNMIKEIVKAQVSIPIICSFLNDYFDIRFVVIENFSFAPKPGSINTVEFSMSLISDIEIDLEKYVIIQNND